jgi:nucleotide-binding universal stress UspA family protein
MKTEQVPAKQEAMLVPINLTVVGRRRRAGLGRWLHVRTSRRVIETAVRPSLVLNIDARRAENPGLEVENALRWN